LKQNIFRRFFPSSLVFILFFVQEEYLSVNIFWWCLLVPFIACKSNISIFSVYKIILVFLRIWSASWKFVVILIRSYCFLKLTISYKKNVYPIEHVVFLDHLIKPPLLWQKLFQYFIYFCKYITSFFHLLYFLFHPYCKLNHTWHHYTKDISSWLSEWVKNLQQQQCYGKLHEELIFCTYLIPVLFNIILFIILFINIKILTN